MQLPEWWIVVSGIFFLFGLVTFVVVAATAWQAMKMLRELQPKVERLSERVESIGLKIESMASTAKGTVDTVGSGTQSMVRAVEGIVSGTGKKLESIAPVLMVAFAAVRLYREFSQARAATKVDKEADEAA